MVSSVQFAQDKAVDFVIVGSGSAGGILAKELSTAGFDVVVFEQGPYRRAADFTHDVLAVLFQEEFLNGNPGSGQTFRDDPDKKAIMPKGDTPVRYA